MSNKASTCHLKISKHTLSWTEYNLYEHKCFYDFLMRDCTFVLIRVKLDQYMIHTEGNRGRIFF